MELIIKLFALYAFAAVAALWAYCIVKLAKPGWTRFELSLPLCVAFLLAPFLLDYQKEPLLITPVAGVLSLAAFKLLAYCLGRGPLTAQWTPTQFAAVLLLPVIPAQVFAATGGGKIDTTRAAAPKYGWNLLQSYSSNMGTALLVSWILALPGIPVPFRHWLYTLSSATFLTAAFELLGAVASPLLGMEFAPAFNKPWLCDSFQDFWARRWNLSTTYILRVLVYEPVVEGRLLAASASTVEGSDESLSSPPCQKGSKETSASMDKDEATSGDEASSHVSGAQPARNARSARAAVQRRKAARMQATGAGGLMNESNSSKIATADSDELVEAPHKPAKRTHVTAFRRYLGLQATFLFSGLWHILIFWYNTHVFSWRWCAFFSIQAAILMVEHYVRKALRNAGFRFPSSLHWLQIIWANSALIFVARPLFFGPADTTGFAQRNLAVGQQVLYWLLDAGLQGMQVMKTAVQSL